MPLTPEQRTSFDDWSSAQGIIPECPICNKRQFEDGGLVVALKLEDGIVNMGGPGIPAILMVCKTCNYMLSFVAAPILGDTL
jgi:hypothetical protein